ncbi:cytochrome c and c1 heme-lyase [Ramaria rubella]|nr:cytochrome c and c1 heme-lyase [Ramaria rubella]
MSDSVEKCPVDHNTRSKWTDLTAASSSGLSPSSLATSRETSSIPRTSSENWVYPSEAQFYAAMARKQHDPRASDMRVIVPIHNAVNERAWAAIKVWEAGRGGEQCGGTRLVSFRGRPGDRSPKAWAKVLLGYTAPFDRHDWVVDRCGVRMRYIIDFYTGRADPLAPHNPSFYIDARPALDNWEGAKMRTERLWERWVGALWGSPVRAVPSGSKNRSSDSSP